jgi:hypothetical protein
MNLINWSYLCFNPNAIPLLEKHIDKVLWSPLSKNPNAVPIIDRNVEKMSNAEWYYLSSNPNALHLLFEYDYIKMKEKCRPLAKELAERVFHPARLLRLCGEYNMEFDEYMDIIG